MNSLRLNWKRRDGGGGKTERDYLDFVIDDVSLSEKFGDSISCLGWTVSIENEKAVRRLLLEKPSDLPNNRRSLYICPECGDLGCGAVSIVVEQNGDQITWRDFAYQNNYLDPLIEEYQDLGPFVFDKTDYEKVLKSAL